MTPESRCCRPYANLDAVVFDLDGVVLDSVDIKTRAFGALYAKHGDEIRARVEAYHIAHGGVSRYDKFRYFQEELVEGPSDDKTIEELSQQFSELVWNSVINSSFIPGAEKTLRLLSTHLPIYVASGTPENELAEILRIQGLREFFIDVYGSPRTKADILGNIIRYGRFAPGKCVMVGDSTTDSEAAQSAGFFFIGICSKAQSPFPTEIPVLPNLEMLPNFLAELNVQIQ